MKNLLSLSLLSISLFLFTTCTLTKEENKELNGTLIVANKSGNDISFIDRATGKTLKTLPTGLQPHEVEVSDDGKYAVVSNYGDRENPGNSLSVYNIKRG
ncbi:MAG TPA: beta-propeller fold lactonase family protein, partial [Bacteroidales bacterium]|nr:beta-propeller fold lactonase family protein [Bacteroidales bacterium]